MTLTCVDMSIVIGFALLVRMQEMPRGAQVSTGRSAALLESFLAWKRFAFASSDHSRSGFSHDESRGAINRSAMLRIPDLRTKQQALKYFVFKKQVGPWYKIRR